MYTTGDIILSRFTYEVPDEPEAYLLLFDRENSIIGLKPAKPAIGKNAYPVRKHGVYGEIRV